MVSMDHSNHPHQKSSTSGLQDVPQNVLEVVCNHQDFVLLTLTKLIDVMLNYFVVVQENHQEWGLYLDEYFVPFYPTVQREQMD